MNLREFDRNLLAGDFEPSGLDSRYTPEELTKLRAEAAVLRNQRVTEAQLRKEARRRARTERERREDGQATLV